MNRSTEETLWTTEEVGHRYDRLSRVPELLAFGESLHFGYWEDPHDEGDLSDAMGRLTDLVIGRLDVGPGSRVLDLGCGVGGPAVKLAATTGAGVVGVTVSREQITKATGLARAEGLAGQVVFQYADAMDLPFDEGSFDAVFGLESIMHMDRPGVLRQIARVLRPGGRLVLTDETLRAPFPPERAEDDETVAGYLRANMIRSLARPEEYQDLLAGAGLVPEAITDITDRTVRPTFRTLWRQANDRLDTILNDLGSPPAAVAEELRGWQRLAEIPEFGYLLISAHRPNR
ncbi:methyltransferase domain-containing protein [Streptomyces niveus]|uniref:SAM-dependent methyltransferase n=1 Tax=Streptomyces niveus TaxID=193462 RepID=UPI00344713DB